MQAKVNRSIISIIAGILANDTSRTPKLYLPVKAPNTSQQSKPRSNNYGGNSQNNAHYPRFGGAKEIARRASNLAKLNCGTSCSN